MFIILLFVNSLFMITYIPSKNKTHKKLTFLYFMLIILIIFIFFNYLSVIIFQNKNKYFLNQLCLKSICCVLAKDVYFKNDISNFKNIEECNKLYLNTKIEFLSKIINNGDKIFLFLATNNLRYKDLIGIVKLSDYIEFEIDNVYNINKLLNEYKIYPVYKENFLDKTINYYFLPFLKKYKTLNGFKVNLQIVYNSNFCKIGYPLIYGSY